MKTKRLTAERAKALFNETFAECRADNFGIWLRDTYSTFTLAYAAEAEGKTMYEDELFETEAYAYADKLFDELVISNGILNSRDEIMFLLDRY